MAAATQTSVKNNGSYRLSGKLGGAGSYISWTGTVTDNIANVAGIPYTGAYTAYSGALAADDQRTSGSTTAWSNAAPHRPRRALFRSSGSATSAGQLNTTAVDSIAYSFSSPVPAGASFMLVDPGASYPEYSGTETFTR